MENLFDLKGLMNLFNANDVKGVVAMEKKLINFLTDEQLVQIANMEKDILNDLVNSKNSYEELKGKYNQVADKLSSIGLNINDMLVSQNNEDDYEEEDEYEDEDEYEEEEDDYED